MRHLHLVRHVAATSLATLAFTGAPTRVFAQPDYHRADQIRVATRHLQNYPDFSGLLGMGQPHWMDDSTRFWYSVETPRGREFLLIDPARLTRAPLFDNVRIASAMSIAGDTAFDPAKLPIRTFIFTRAEQSIAFRVGTKRYECDIAKYTCVKGDTISNDVPEWAVRSPNKQWEAYVSKSNVWIRRSGVDAAQRDSLQLTTDGAPMYEYGLAANDNWRLDSTARRKPDLVWSPDSKKLAVMQIDERKVRRLPVYSSSGIHAKLFTYPTSTPDDSIISTTELHILDVATKGNVRVQLPPQPLRTLGWNDNDAIQWSPASDRVFVIHAARANKKAELFWTDAASGAAHKVVGDSSSTFVENASGIGAGNWRAIGTGKDVIWWSERDGWGHLYRYSDDGKLLGQVTSGPWLVDRVRYVDHATRQVYFSALGREKENPYYSQLWRVNLDGALPTLLTPEPGVHNTYVVPTGKYFIDIYSRPDQSPVTTLRSLLDGRRVMTLESADARALTDAGWRAPVPFTTKARDGVTELRGLMWLPARLDSTQRYPVVDNIYPGPQVGSVFNFGFNTDADNAALASLGFVVIQVNSMGTPGRSKAFHDFYYGNMGDNGIADHVSAIKELGARYRFMDLDRVGIYGVSGGGFSSTGAILRFPDFFKVAVSVAGNHDNRSYFAFWGEKYQGLYKRDAAKASDNFENQANYLLAGNLKGKLLLIHGDMDTNVHPSMTLRLVDALIKAEKDFDMLIIPDAGHAFPDYAVRRSWDYFVRNLRGEEPPKDYHMVKEVP